MSAEEAREEMEAARSEVVECEKEIQSIKGKLSALRQSSQGATDGEQEPPNSLEVAVLKVDGLPEGATPSFELQLSSPIEELKLDKLFDPLAPTENLAVFSGVEASVATLIVSVKDADVALGVSTPSDVAPLCQFDAMSPQQNVTELDIAILPEDSAQEKEQVEPTCTLTLRVTFKPSAKDQREELYDLLNKASHKKAKAIDRLRKSATAVSRAAGPSTEVATTRSPAIKSGFLQSKKKKPSKIKAWYERTVGPTSLLRQSILPIAKNYVIFFGAVIVFHFKGHDLALPPPV